MKLEEIVKKLEKDAVTHYHTEGITSIAGVSLEEKDFSEKIDQKLAGDGTDSKAGSAAKYVNIEGYGTYHKIADSYGDIFEGPHVWKDAIKSMPLMLANHDSWDEVGVWDDVKVEEKGLYFKGRVSLETKSGAEWFAIAKMKKAKMGLSIGFRIGEYKKGQKKDERIITRVDWLAECSLVKFPAMPDAGVSVKDRVAIPDRVSLAGLISAKTGLPMCEARALVDGGYCDLLEKRAIDTNPDVFFGDVASELQAIKERLGLKSGD